MNKQTNWEIIKQREIIIRGMRKIDKQEGRLVGGQKRRKAERQKGREASMHAGEAEETRRERKEGRQAGGRVRREGGKAGGQAGFGHPSIMCLFHHRTQPARREANNTIPPLPPMLFTFPRCWSDARPPRKVSRPDMFLVLCFI